ncbi:BA14K family protein [Pararhizobium sp. PWRC1-1]|uniref:BA14K family protein n=1 Tax=Pararhizobium sp. PWRC1-1 TaxID=2804566 RepID=UPI003CE8BE46
MLAQAKPPRRVNLTLVGTSTGDTSSEQNGASNVDPAQLNATMAQEWCGARYRSYDPNDNTYQPYGGGPRRVCAAPLDTMVAFTERVAGEGVAKDGNANARWCMERYSSYRVEDNTYQPFSGGRKQCIGPGSQSASNFVEKGSVVQF